MTIAAAGAAAGVGLAVAVPGAALLLHPLRRKTVTGGEEPVRVPIGAPEIPTSRPVRVELVADRRDGWTHFERVKLGAAFLIREAAGPIRAFSAVCPHLGCTVEWDPRAERFECPCHQSGFGLDGRCLSGPAPRGLDELDVIATGAELRIRYRRFRAGSRLKEPIG